MLEDLKSVTGQPMSLTELDQLRQVIGADIAGAVDKSERRLGKLMIKQIDKFIDQNGGGDLVKSARAANARYAKADAVARAVSSAERRAASTGTGGNEDNAIRQNVRRLIEKYERGGTSFKPDEIELMERVVRGSTAQNAARHVGRLSPTTGGMSGMLNTGAALLDPLLAIPGGIGFVSKVIADRATKGNIQSLELAIRGAAQTPAQKQIASAILGNKTIMAGLRNAAAAEAGAVLAPLELTITPADIPR